MDKSTELQLLSDDKDREIADVRRALVAMDLAWQERGDVIDGLVREIKDKDEALATIRRVMNPQAHEDQFPTDGIARNRTELIWTLKTRIAEVEAERDHYRGEALLKAL